MKQLPKPALILGAAGTCLLLLGDLYNSFGFLVCVAGCGLLLWCLLLLIGHFQKSSDPKIRKYAKTVKYITFTAILAFLVSFLIIEGLIVSHSRGTEAPDADTLIVLGAGLHGDAPSATLASRLQVALDYLQTHPGAVAIVTGGQGARETVTEASAMAKWLTGRGIDPARVYLEEQATDTVENLRYSKAILEKEGLSGPVLVVSNGFHLFRAEKLAEQAGLGAVQTLGAPVPQVWLIPSVYLREYCSVLLMLLRTIV